MSAEKQPNTSNPEQQQKLEAIQEASDSLCNLHERELTKEEETHGEKSQIEQILRTAESKAHAAAQERSHLEQSSNNHHPVLVNKNLKETSYHRTLVRTQKQLSRPSRVFSKMVHSKVLDRPSEAVGKTIARPSGMLGGAIVAFIGTSALIWITRHYGYEYNYLVVSMLFIGGMSAGLLLEALLRIIRLKRSH